MKTFDKNKMKRGYTLIEIVVYIAVLSLVSIVVVNSFIVSISSSKVAFEKRNLLEAGNTIMERMAREIRLADTVVDANSTFDSDPGVLEISSTDSVSGTRTVKFQVDSGEMSMYENGSLYGSISGDKVAVSSLFFRKITTSSGVAIKIELGLLGGQGHVSNFYNTVALRGAY